MAGSKTKQTQLLMQKKLNRQHTSLQRWIKGLINDDEDIFEEIRELQNEDRLPAEQISRLEKANGDFRTKLVQYKRQLFKHPSSACNYESMIEEMYWDIMENVEMLQDMEKQMIDLKIQALRLVFLTDFYLLFSSRRGKALTLSL